MFVQTAVRKVWALFDEVAEVRLPAPVVVREEDERAVVQKDPAGEVDALDAAQVSAITKALSRLLDERQDEPEGTPAEGARLQRDDVREPVLGRAVLGVEDRVQAGRVIRLELRRVRERLGVVLRLVDEPKDDREEGRDDPVAGEDDVERKPRVRLFRQAAVDRADGEPLLRDLALQGCRDLARAHRRERPRRVGRIQPRLHRPAHFGVELDLLHGKASVRDVERVRFLRMGACKRGERAGSIALAEGEELVELGTDGAHQIREVRVLVSVVIGLERERGAAALAIEDDEPAEVERIGGLQLLHDRALRRVQERDEGPGVTAYEIRDDGQRALFDRRAPHDEEYRRRAMTTASATSPKLTALERHASFFS